jgi:hypothetical protein
MRDLGPELERREHARQRPGVACELLLDAQRYPARILDASRGGLFVSTEAPVWPSALVRVQLEGTERSAVVVHERHIPPRLRALLPHGVGLRWVRSSPSD